MSSVSEGRLEVELDALISLIAKSLYTDPLVCIRELLANATDALTKKRAAIQGGGLADDGRCECRIWFDGHELCVDDTGIGLTAEEVREYLTKIGASGTRMLKDGAPDGDLARSLIGQFGIGILSSWVISDSIVVRTKSAKISSAEGVLFECSADGRFRISRINQETPGTRVSLQVRKLDYVNMLHEEFDRRVRQYSLLLPFPVVDRFSVQRFNIDRATALPWSNSNPTAATLSKFVQKHSEGSAPIYSIPIGHGDGLRMGGVVYVPALSNFVNAPLAVELYSRGMLVRRDAPNILPDGGVFLSGIVECDDLTPIMSREDVAKDTVYSKFKAELARQILVGLAQLACDEWGAAFEDAIATHSFHLRQFLRYNDTPIPRARFEALGEGLSDVRAALGNVEEPTLFDVVSLRLKYPVAGTTLPMTLLQYVGLMRRRQNAEERRNIYYSFSSGAADAHQIDAALGQRGLHVIILPERSRDTGGLQFGLLEKFAARRGFVLVHADSRGDIFPATDGPEWRKLERIFQAAASQAVQLVRGQFNFRATTIEGSDRLPVLMVQQTHSEARKDLENWSVSGPNTVEKAKFERMLELAKKQLAAEENTILCLLNTRHPLMQLIATTAPTDSPTTLVVAREILHTAMEYSGFVFSAGGREGLRDTRLVFLELALLNAQALDRTFSERLARA